MGPYGCASTSKWPLGTTLYGSGIESLAYYLRISSVFGSKIRLLGTEERFEVIA